MDEDGKWSHSFVPEVWMFRRIVQSFTMMAPSVRMVVVYAETCMDESKNLIARTGIAPIVAIRSTMSDLYSHSFPEGYNSGQFEPVKFKTSPDHNFVVSPGWEYERRIIEDHFLFIDERGSMADAVEEFGTLGKHHEIAICSWHPENDHGRLADVVSRVAERALSD